MLSKEFSLKRLAKSQESWSENCDENSLSPYQCYLTLINREIRDLLKIKREIKVLQNHQHDWNSDDYCNICGADGRA